MTYLDMEISPGGKVAIPLELSAAMGWQAGDQLTVQIQNGEIRIFSQVQAIRRAQAWVASFVAEERSLADELLAERRQDSQFKTEAHHAPQTKDLARVRKN
jgi:antitoxin component of MazEF toxin-antitoxin module